MNRHGCRPVFYSIYTWILLSFLFVSQISFHSKLILTNYTERVINNNK